MLLLFFCKEFMILKYAVAVFWPDFLWLICRENLIDAFFFQSPNAFSHTFLNMKFNDFFSSLILLQQESQFFEVPAAEHFFIVNNFYDL